MSNLNQFLSGVHSRSPTSIIRANSVAGWTKDALGFVNLTTGAKVIASGALTSATLATILSVTGGGILEFLSISMPTGDATARTMRLQLTIDGIAVWDYTSASSSSWAQNDGAIIVGSANAAATGSVAVPFNTSLVIKVASSVTETDKFNIGVKYWTV